MLLRVGLLLVVTGLTFVVVGWLGAIGPALMIIGSGCAAVAFEHVLAAEQVTTAEEPVVPARRAAPTGGTHRAA
jgi:hypothetical protein